MVNINTWRRLSQVLFFLLLVYGGYLYLKPVDTEALPFVVNNTNVGKISTLTAPQGYTEVLDTYMPFRTCRYMDGNRIFRACSVHFLTEVPVYGVPWYFFIPHLLVILLVSFLFGRFVCGWVCPLGSFSDFMGIIRKWVGLERLQLPGWFMEIIKKLRSMWLAVLAILAIAIALPFIGLLAFRNELFLIACQTCPARNLFPLISGLKPTWFTFDSPITATISIIGIIFIVMLVLGFFGKRIWCRFCPNGLILSWFNKGCMFVKEKDARKCTRCGVCERVCPMDNDSVYENKKGGNVNAENCIDCYTCVDKCPEDGCLKVRFAGLSLFASRLKGALGLNPKEYDDSKGKVLIPARKRKKKELHKNARKK
jgi:ferredoxin-type protein NapH